MMGNMSGLLKTAYELANKRMIASSVSEQAQNKKAEAARLDALPEFVESWKSPYDKDEDEYSSAFIDKRGNPKKEETTYDGIIVKEPETIYYREPQELHWYGNFTSYTGFSKMNRSLVFGLANKGVNIKIDMQNCPVEVNDSTMKELDRLSSNDISPNAPKVFCATIPLKFHHTGYKILYTMMENSETLHKDYVDKINMFNEVWVPTYFNKVMFKNNGVRIPVYVMPLGVDTDRYTPKAEPFDFNFGLNEFVFLSVFKWNIRKGWDILLKAFLEEFDAEEPVSLLIVSRTDVHHKPEVIQQDFITIRDSVRKDVNNLPHVALYDKPIREKDMPSIYKRGNAFVLMSRGEGFCLPICEAAACGLPIISTNCSGQTDYLTNENSFLVDPDGYQKASINGNLSRLAKHCHFYDNQSFPDFGRDALEQAKQHMRYVYTNYVEAKVKARKLTETIHNEYSWDEAVNKIFDRIKDMK